MTKNLETVSCKPNPVPLNLEQIKEYSKQLNNWSVLGNKLVKTYDFENFSKGWGFVQVVAEIAERMNHHPKIVLTTKRVDLELNTQKTSQLTINDFVLAAKIDQIPESFF